MRHVIQKQIIRFKASDNKGTYQMQQRMGRLYRRSIVPWIDKCCSQLSNADEIHRIDRIVIDLGKIKRHHLNDRFVEKAKPIIYEQIKQAIEHASKVPPKPQSATTSPTKAKKLTSTSNQPSGAKDKKPTREETSSLEQQQETAARTSKPSALHQWLFFLRTGTFPWWTRKPTRWLLHQLLSQITQHPPQQLHLMLADIANKPNQLQRLLHHTSDNSLFKLLNIAVPTQAPLLKNLYQKLSSPNLSNHPDRATLAQLPQLKVSPIKTQRTLYWETLLLALPKANAPSTSKTQEALVQQILLDVAAALPLPYPTLLQQLNQTLGKQNTPLKRTLTALQNTKDGLDTSDEIEDPRKSTLEKSNEASEEEVLKNTDPKNLEDDEEAIPQKAEDPFDHSDKLYIENAGLVLLHPFLSNFFENLQLVKKDEKEKEEKTLPWVSTSAQQRAALLLQYLATGKPKGIIEPQLPLNKILCGLDLAQPMPVNLTLSETEIQACEELLQAVISHHEMWNSLSIDDFRRAHLQREGLLSNRDGGWLLRVERKTYDVIIDHLPWSLNIIR